MWPGCHETRSFALIRYEKRTCIVCPIPDTVSLMPTRAHLSDVNSGDGRLLVGLFRASRVLGDSGRKNTVDPAKLLEFSPLFSCCFMCFVVGSSVGGATAFSRQLGRSTTKHETTRKGKGRCKHTPTRRKTLNRKDQTSNRMAHARSPSKLKRYPYLG